MEEKYMNVTKIIQEELGQMLEKDGFQSDFKKNIWTYEREKNGVRQEITILTDRYNKKVLVNKCVGNIYSTIYRCWYPQIFINIGIQVIA